MYSVTLMTVAAIPIIAWTPIFLALLSAELSRYLCPLLGTPNPAGQPIRTLAAVACRCQGGWSLDDEAIARASWNRYISSLIFVISFLSAICICVALASGRLDYLFDIGSPKTKVSRLERRDVLRRWLRDRFHIHEPLPKEFRLRNVRTWEYEIERRLWRWLLRNPGLYWCRVPKPQGTPRARLIDRVFLATVVGVFTTFLYFELAVSPEEYPKSSGNRFIRIADFLFRPIDAARVAVFRLLSISLLAFVFEEINFLRYYEIPILYMAVRLLLWLSLFKVLDFIKSAHLRFCRYRSANWVPFFARMSHKFDEWGIEDIDWWPFAPEHEVEEILAPEPPYKRWTCALESGAMKKPLSESSPRKVSRPAEEQFVAFMEGVMAMMKTTKAAIETFKSRTATHDPMPLMADTKSVGDNTKPSPNTHTSFEREHFKTLPSAPLGTSALVRNNSEALTDYAKPTATPSNFLAMDHFAVLRPVVSCASTGWDRTSRRRYLYLIVSQTKYGEPPFVLNSGDEPLRITPFLLSPYNALTFDMLAGTSGLADFFEVEIKKGRGFKLRPKGDAYLKEAVGYRLINCGSISTAFKTVDNGTRQRFPPDYSAINISRRGKKGILLGSRLVVVL